MDTTGWILLILLGLAIIAFIVFLILYLTKKANSNNINKELSISGLNFRLTNASTLTATWTSVGNPSDVINLYADTSVVNLDANGKPIKTTVLSSGPVSGTANTISLTGLQPNTTYFAVLVVTNPNLTGHNAEPDVLFTGEIPSGEFRISEITTDGAITLGSDAKSVTYVPGNNKTDISDLWTYDTTNFTLSATPTGGNSSQGKAFLYNNNGILAATSSSNITKDNSEWDYNASGLNRWCLKNTQLCMNLSPGETSISVGASETKWKNIPEAVANSN